MVFRENPGAALACIAIIGIRIIGKHGFVPDMTGIDTIQKKITSARTNARAYWFVAAICFFMQLFPVLHNAEELQFEPALQTKIVLATSELSKDDHVPGAIDPAAAGKSYTVTPGCSRLCARPVIPASADICPYLATGPPAA
ncbi:MAG: hypothetical protein AB7J19_09910 [Beijerinckiaceae bacterium]